MALLLHGSRAKPRTFIGSSAEGLRIAELIQLGLHHDVEATLWSQGVFGLSNTAFEDLTRACREYDFATLVLTPDDLTDRRGNRRSTPRDNVIFELGLFTGALGSDRTFVVHPQDEPVDLPTDLDGVNTVTYAERADGNLEAALGPVCTKLKLHIRKVAGICGFGPSCDATGAEPKFVPRRRRRRSLGLATSIGPKKDFQISNISVTGALLATDAELPVGQLLDLALTLDDGQKAQVTARVVRVQRPDWGIAGGVGVAFTDVADQAKKIIEAYVEADPL